MNNSSLKKREERKQLERFVELSGAVPSGVSVVEREAPDFLLKHRDWCVGVEVRALTDEALAKGASFAAQLEEQLNEVVRDLGTEGIRPHVHVGVFQGGPARAERGWVEETAAQLAELVRGQARQGLDRKEYGQDRLREAGITQIRTVVVELGDESKVTLGHLPAGAKAPSVEKAIEDKNARVPSYRESVPDAREIWLLLVLGGRLANGVDSSAIRERSFDSDFDRVYLLDLDRAAILQLDPPQ
jgi:hypothetical protein